MNINKKLFLLILTFLFLLVENSFIYAIEDNNEHDGHDELFRSVEITDGSTLSVADCVALAYKNSPKIRRKLYELNLAQSNYNLAKSRFFPIFNAGVGLNFIYNSDSIYYDKRYRDLPAIGVSLNQLIWDFGKSTSYIKMEKFYKIATEYEFMDSICYTLFDVKAKYYKLLQAKALYNIAKNNVEINEKFIKLAKGKNKVDLTTAQLNLSEAKIHLIEAEKTVNNEKYNLSNAMYIDVQPKYDIENTSTFTYNDDYAYGSKLVETKPFEPYVLPFKPEEAPEIAYQNSPDLKVLIATKKAMENNLKFAKRAIMPELSANLGYGYNNSKYVNNTSHNNSLAVGLGLATSVNFMEYRANIKGADAHLNLAENEINLFKKDLYYEIQRALNNVNRTEKQVPLAKLEVEQSLDNLKTVEQKYQTNEVSYVALQDARKDYIRALNSYIDSIYNYNISLIQVEMAMHYHLVDIHHKTEHAMHYHDSTDIINHMNKVLNCDEKEVKVKAKKKNKRQIKQ